ATRALPDKRTLTRTRGGPPHTTGEPHRYSSHIRGALLNKNPPHRGAPLSQRAQPGSPAEQKPSTGVPCGTEILNRGALPGKSAPIGTVGWSARRQQGRPAGA